MAQARDSSGRFVSMKVKVEVEGADAAASTVGHFEKTLNSFGDRVTQAAGATAVFGSSIRKTGANAIDYANKISSLSKAMQQSKSMSERLAGAGLGAVASGMNHAAQGVKGLGEQVMKSGFAIGRMGRLIVSQLTPYAQWADKSRVVKVSLVALNAAMTASKHVAMGLGTVGWKSIQGIASAAKGAYNHLGGLTGILGRIKGSLLGMTSNITGPLSVSGLAEISDKFDQINIDLAQTIKLMSKDAAMPFKDAFAASEDLMGKIIQKAGPLPGEASDYAKAMAIAGTVVNKTTHDQERTLNLVSDMTALWGGDGVMAAKMLNQSLDPMKGRINAATMNGAKLFAIFRSIPGQAKLTSVEFNRMSADKRLAIVTKAMELSQDKIKALANTYDAKMGAAKANWEWLVKAASPHIFDALKASLDVFNEAILDSNGKFTPLAQSVIATSKYISQGIVIGLKRATVFAKDLYVMFQKFTKSDAFAKIAKTANNLVSAVGKAGAGLLKGAGGMDAMQNRAASVGDTLLNQALPIINKLTVVVEPLFTAIGTIAGVIFDSLWPALDGLLAGVNALTGPVAQFAAGAYDTVTVIVNTLKPSLVYAGNAIGTLAKGLGEFLAPIIRIVGTAALKIYNVFASYLVPVLGKVVSAFAFLITGLGQFLSWLGKKIGQSLFGDDLSPLMDAAFQGMSKGFENNFGNFWMPGAEASTAVPSTNVGGEHKPEDTVPEGRGGGGRTVQDFRFSRFDISQKFDESFDPDRVATAFSEKLSRIGDRKLQSGFEPLFSVSR